MIPLFDLHCDTLLKLYNNNEDFKENQLHISLNKASIFSPYIQVLAIWSDNQLSNDEAFHTYKKVVKYAKEKNILNNSFILAVEDARILNGDITRLDTLFNDKVRVITLNWAGNSIIGGAWDTSFGLSSFGKEVVAKSIDLGIIPDISHSSIPASNEIIDICQSKNYVPIASHSNSYAICPHKRNLSDELFKEIVGMKGLVGISLASEHLCSTHATIYDILKHIYHYLSLGGENVISLGCDFDGVNTLPQGIASIKDLDKLFFLTKSEFGQEIAYKFFYKNAFEFFYKHS